MPPPSPAQVCNLPTYDFAKDGYAYLQAHKRREHALMAATGLSVGRLTAEQSAFLQEHMDVWATNQFFLHQHLIPDFYNLEMRTVPLSVGRKERRQLAERALSWLPQSLRAFGARALGEKKERIKKREKRQEIGLNNAVMWNAFDANMTKRHAYRKTVFLTKHEHAHEVARLLQRRSPCPQAQVAYWVKSAYSSCNVRKARQQIMEKLQVRGTSRSHLVTEYCGSSITRILDMMLRLGYKTASLIGVDLTSAHHFYTALPEYAAVARTIPSEWESSVQAFARRQNKNTTLHATGARGITNFFDAFNAAHGRHGRMRLINLSPESLLGASKYIPTSPPPRAVPTEDLRESLERWWQKTYLLPPALELTTSRP